MVVKEYITLSNDGVSFCVLLACNLVPCHSHFRIAEYAVVTTSEFSLLTVTAVIHHHLDNRWMIIGPSRVGVYHNTDNNSFRIVARKISKVDQYEVSSYSYYSSKKCYKFLFVIQCA